MITEAVHIITDPDSGSPKSYGSGTLSATVPFVFLADAKKKKVKKLAYVILLVR
jgi:hypothetical protein